MPSFDYHRHPREWWRGFPAIPLGGGDKLVPISARELDLIRDALDAYCNRQSSDAHLEDPEMNWIARRFAALAAD